MMKKLAMLVLSSCYIFNAAVVAQEYFSLRYDEISEDMPMQCPKCGKTHRPTTPCS